MLDIIAIGGGGVAERETLAIDQEFVARAGKVKPTLLFIPTASDDSEEYVANVTDAYGALGCRVEALRVWTDDTDPEANAGRIRAADLIYVGGGNTKKMLTRWAEVGITDVLREVVPAGKPVGGLSAGAICWFRTGNSDWPQYEGIPNVNTARLDCLGFIDLVACPHTRDEGFRLAEFTAMMAGEPGYGIGLDECCAIHIKGDRFRLIASQSNTVAHRVWWHDGHPRHDMLEPDGVFRPLSVLMSP